MGTRTGRWKSGPVTSSIHDGAERTVGSEWMKRALPPTLLSRLYGVPSGRAGKGEEAMAMEAEIATGEGKGASLAAISEVQCSAVQCGRDSGCDERAWPGGKAPGPASRVEKISQQLPCQ